MLETDVLIRKCALAAEIAFVSAQRWTRQVKRMAPLLPVHHLLVGSNIPLSDVTQTVISPFIHGVSAPPSFRWRGIASTLLDNLPT